MEPTVTASPDAKVNYQFIAISQIQASPHQARKDFDEEALKGLAESMKHEGLIEPIVVRPVDTGFELISGERRLRAAKMLGWEIIETKIIGTVSEAEAAVKGLIENLQREDLNPIEEAEGFLALKSMNDKHWTQEQLARVVGKTQEYVSRSLSLLGLPEGVIGFMRRRIISRDHGIELLRFKDAKSQKRMATKMDKKGLSVKQTREAVTRALEKNKINPSAGTQVSGTSVPRVGLKDPLEHLWPSIEIDPSITKFGAWRVSYGSYRVMGEQAPTAPSWCFYVMTPGVHSRSELARWFQAMADSLTGERKAEARPESQEEPTGRRDVAAEEALKRMLPSNMEEAKQMQKEQENIRLPKTPAEERELEALAAQGPGAVYAWIWGPNSVLARRMKSVTWADLDITDPIEGCRTVLEGMKS